MHLRSHRGPKDCCEGRRASFSQLFSLGSDILHLGPNVGRPFYCCPNVSKSAQCKYFEWSVTALSVAKAF